MNYSKGEGSFWISILKHSGVFVNQIMSSASPLREWWKVGFENIHEDRRFKQSIVMIMFHYFWPIWCCLIYFTEESRANKLLSRLKPFWKKLRPIAYIKQSASNSLSNTCSYCTVTFILLRGYQGSRTSISHCRLCSGLVADSLETPGLSFWRH